MPKHKHANHDIRNVCEAPYTLRTGKPNAIAIDDHYSGNSTIAHATDHMYGTRTFILRSKRNHVRVVYTVNNIEKIEILRQLWDVAHKQCTPSERVKVIEVFIPCRHDDLCALLNFDPSSPRIGHIYTSSSTAKLRLLTLSMAMSYIDLVRYIKSI